MNANTSLLLRLIRSELWQSDAGIDPAIESPDWEAIIAEARRQTVVGLLANAVERIADPRMLPPFATAARLMAEAENIRIAYRHHCAAQQSLLDSLAAYGLKPTVVKGLTCAAFYPDPAARQSGDIDIFIPPDQDTAIDRFLTERHITAVGHADGSRSFPWDGIEIELHPRLTDIHSPRSLRRIDAIGISSDRPETVILLLAAHIFKHAIGHGVGLRQLCDLAMATSRLRPHIDTAAMQRLSRAAGLSRWMPKVYSLLATDLGLPAGCLPYPMDLSDKKARQLRKIIARGGNFGFHQSASASRKGPASTALAFLRRAGFSLSTAPSETIHTVITLAKGRL